MIGYIGITQSNFFLATGGDLFKGVRLWIFLIRSTTIFPHRSQSALLNSSTDRRSELYTEDVRAFGFCDPLGLSLAREIVYYSCDFGHCTVVVSWMSVWSA